MAVWRVWVVQAAAGYGRAACERRIGGCNGRYRVKPDPVEGIGVADGVERLSDGALISGMGERLRTGPADVVEPVDAAPAAVVQPGPAEPEAAEPPARKSMTSRVKSGSLWTILGYGGGQVLRFGANILMAQILIAEDFGLMGQVMIVMIGLQMFSDIGIGPAIIQSDREDATFLNTAWTMQVLRGFALFAVGCAAAWPMAQLWDERLLWLLPVASLTAVAQGFQSTKYFTANRHMAVKWLMLIELGASIIATAVMVALVYTVLPNAWALVLGFLIATVVKTVMTFFLPGNTDRLCFDREAAGQLFHFGKWLFLSTVITFLAFQVDNLLLTSIFGSAALGIYWIGRQLADVGKDLFMKLGQLLGFPALAEIYRENRDLFYKTLLRTRVLLVLPINALLLGMIVFAPTLFYALYDPHYWGAGWVVQALAVNSLAGMLNTSYGHAYMASGRTKFNTATVTGQFVCVVLPAMAGYGLAGETGFILGVAVSQFVKYPVDMVLTRRIGVWQWKFDFAVLVGSTALAVACLYLATLLAEPSVAMGDTIGVWVDAGKAWVKGVLGMTGGDA